MKHSFKDELLPGDLTVSMAKQMLSEDRIHLAASESRGKQLTEQIEVHKEALRLLMLGVEAELNSQLEAGKSLAVLNSAGAAGALAFAQALISKGALDDFKFFAVIATFCFLLGACAGASTPRALIAAKMLSASEGNAFPAMRKARWCLSTASITFAVGALTFLWGICVFG